MTEPKEKLIKSLKLWLKKNELDGDTAFYSQKEWKERGEEYHNDAEFVITMEGRLYYLLNYDDSDEFHELVNSFDFIAEMGHSWNIGFYLDPMEGIKQNISYSDKLKDKRWQEKRKLILARCDGKCEDCGNKSELEIHHCYYTYGNEPWQYPLDSLRGLCDICHEKRGMVEMLLRAHMASIRTAELENIISYIKASK